MSKQLSILLIFLCCLCTKNAFSSSLVQDSIKIEQLNEIADKARAKVDLATAKKAWQQVISIAKSNSHNTSTSFYKKQLAYAYSNIAYFIYYGEGEYLKALETTKTAEKQYIDAKLNDIKLNNLILHNYEIIYRYLGEEKLLLGVHHKQWLYFWQYQAPSMTKAELYHNLIGSSKDSRLNLGYQLLYINELKKNRGNEWLNNYNLLNFDNRIISLATKEKIYARLQSNPSIDSVQIGYHAQILATKFLEAQNYTKALHYMQLSSKYYVNPYKSDLDDFYKKYIAIYTGLKNIPQAFAYQQKLLALKKEEEQKDEKKQLAQKMFKEQLAQQELVNKLIQDKQKAAFNVRQKKQQLTLYATSSIVFLLSLLALSIYRTNKKQKRANTLLNEQRQQIAEKNKEINDSVNYALGIQQSLLTTEAYIQQFQPHSFVFFQPKDVVSGDFYWFDKKDHLHLFAVADCTGHGVPGSMMSMLCINLLQLIVDEKHISSPAQVLTELDKKLTEMLHAQGHINMVNDGMDIVFVEYNTQTNILRYSGANRPLYISKSLSHLSTENLPFDSLTNVSPRGDSEGLKLLELKPSKYSIGGQLSTKHFELHEIQLNPNDCFYLSSDGYADQFGGEKGKKITTKKLKELLATHSNQTITQQRDVLSTYYSQWKGSLEQIDDVCMMGVKVS